ncbi:MAG: electron transfer flavoprotein subunit alpha/FixB family protein [Thermoplasmatota archaeon]
MMIMIFSDVKKNGFELVGKGREMAGASGGSVTAVLTGKNAEADSLEYIHHGADKVITAGAGMENFKAEEVADILAQAAKNESPDLVLIASTKNGKELAPRLAARLEAGCSTDCSNIYMDGGDVITERVVYSGNAVAVQKFESKPAIATIPGKVFDPLPKDEGRIGEVLKLDSSPGEYASKILEVQKMISEGVNVEDAEIIVSCGRGFKNSGDIKLIEELADTLHGTTLGCSRPIAADLKWLSEDHWIGLSGHKVKPKLYIACGISGQIQHVAGMRDSGIIVAINKDPDAPIFEVADYGIAGDLYEVVPALTEALR